MRICWIYPPNAIRFHDTQVFSAIFQILDLEICFSDIQLYRHFLSIFSAVQHERAPRTYSKKPSYFSDFSAIAAGAAAVAAASNHHQIAPGSIHSGARPPLLNPLGIPHGMHPYYPLHHFKSFFPALFPHATSGEFISMTSILTHTVAQPTKWRLLPKNLS